MSITATPTKRYRNYVLGVLTAVYTFNFIDRQLLVILQESVKAELDLSDTQLGVLTGFTFAIFYVTLGIPIARLADRWNRRNVVAISLTIWSAMTAISGAVQNFVQLALARVGVGIGEAGGSPPAHAMISDYFPPHQRGRAMSVYSIGIYIGILLGFVLGGILNTAFGWRVSFVVIGIPGIILAGILYVTVREPLRGTFDKGNIERVSFGYVMRFVFSRKSFVFLALGTGCHTFAMYAMGNWMPSILFRIHGMSNEVVGISLGIAIGVGGAVGSYLGGWLSDKLGKLNTKWYLWVPAIGGAVGVPLAIIAILSGSPYLVIGAYALMYVSMATYLAPCIAITHNIVPANMRAFSSAILFFVLNFIGLGFGPLTVGYLSDLLAPQYGIHSLKWALLSCVIMVVIGVFLFMRASRYVREDLNAMVEAHHESQ